MKLSKDLIQIAINLRSARIESDLDADALAKAAGTSEAHIRQIENGETPPPGLAWLERAATAMHVPLSRLLDLDPVKVTDGQNSQDGKEENRRRTCRWALPEFDGTTTCRNPDAADRQTVNDAACQACAAYSSRYIQYPLEVGSITLDRLEGWGLSSVGDLVAVRPCSGNPEERTYLGLYLGQQPWTLAASFNNRTKDLAVRSVCNPLIYVFETRTLVRGADSWWSRIESPDDLKEITDANIEATWYVKLLREMAKRE